ncbi:MULTISPECIES: hypothetical protein [unclassified Microbacterium]|uniref:hypothetical protein n=1 Tax=unclassified Microbacterium TaxID=2609290 RepID=UPI0011AFCF58|nr:MULTISPECIES: hypothetical protein [unclassified Microbacterium]
MIAVFSAIVLIAGDWITDWCATLYRGEGNANARVGAALPRWALSAASPIGLVGSLVTYNQRAEACGSIAVESPGDALALFGGAALVVIGLSVLAARHYAINRSMRRVAENDLAGRRAMRSARGTARLLTAIFLLPGMVLVVVGGW